MRKRARERERERESVCVCVREGTFNCQREQQRGSLTAGQRRVITLFIVEKL